MGNSRFRLSHVMPNVWFYKLRDMGKIRESQRRLQRSISTRDESAINMPRSSFRFSRIQRVQKAQVVENQAGKRKAANKGKKSKSGFSVESKISASCSCKATLESVRKTGEKKEEFWSSDEQEVDGDYLSKKSNQFALELESKNRNWKLPRHQSTIVAALSSPAHKDFSQVQPLDMIELVGDPFVLNTSFICSNSGSYRLNCPSSKEKGGLEGVPVSFFDIISPDLYSIWATDVEEKQRFIEYLEECKPSITRPRQGQSSQYGIKEQRGGEKNSVTAHRRSDSEKMQTCSDVGIRAFRRQGKWRSHLCKNKPRSCSSKPNGRDWKSSTFAVVKSSSDPQRDFIESMEEMITEKNIDCYGDLQRLLECYLSLNSPENHDMIVKAFERVSSEFIQMPS